MRVHIQVEGAVQGVGFRPHAYRLASELGLTGWVANQPAGVRLEVEGPPDSVEAFLRRLPAELPSPGKVAAIQSREVPEQGELEFRIVQSLNDGACGHILPDLATCPACLRELRDPADRRYAYPFTNCTHCGPRYTILEGLPYDRAATTMKGFVMCERCRAEYVDPQDRRFHAQPNACPRCGPCLSTDLEDAARLVERGGILALKGLGGFQLLVDARSPDAVQSLRRAKGRSDKPFAVMARHPERFCRISEAEEVLLRGPEAPIVLLERLPGEPPSDAPCDEVAPGNLWLGVMLPYTPLHHRLMERLDFPVVATSGNLSDDPILIHDHEAARLPADGWLSHNRPIARRVDDSVVHFCAGAPRLIRRARGYAPRPIRLPVPTSAPILALGGHQKCTLALAIEDRVVVGQHLGDLDSPAALEAFEQAALDLCRLHRVEPTALACDLHPDYASTRWAEGRGLPLLRVQHHHAHLASVLLDSGQAGPVLGIIWDGTGYGPDGTIWGGEFLVGDAHGYRRDGHILPFRLPGGEIAAREPRRCALGLLRAAGLEAPVPGLAASELRLLDRMLESGVNSPLTTSMGRLFDGVACLLGLMSVASFEGQAAMALEFAAAPEERGTYSLPRTADGVLDWRILLRAMLEDRSETSTRAARFHNALVEAALEAARACGPSQVALSGGCFQNRRLLEGLSHRLTAAGFEVLLHGQVPCNDGGLSLGQAAVAVYETSTAPRA